jgi:hypothetical protein
MKKFLFTKLFLFAFLLLTGVFTVTAADFMVNGICYNIIGDNQVEVTAPDSTEYSGDITIPATVVNDGITYKVTRLSKYTFKSCSDLTSVELSEGLIEIGNLAFYFCRNLEYVELPSSLVKIGEFAFVGCSAITSFYIPRNVTSIAKNAFLYCTGVNDFMVSGSNPCYKSVAGVLYTKDMTMLVAYPPAATAASYVIPETVTRLQDFAFHFNDHLTQVTIPESVTWVGGAAFRDCDGLTSLYFPDGITHIGSSGFSECDNLTSVHLPANLDTIHNNMCGELTSLTSITIPRSVRCIDNYAFQKATGFKSIIFEEGSCLDSIGMSAFDECTSLESFDMPNSVTKIGGEPFGFCYSLKNIHFSENLQILRGSTLWECTSLVEVEVPSSVAFIDHSNFYGCTSLKRLKIGDKDATTRNTVIGRGQVHDCPSLDRIELGTNISGLQGDAFGNCDNLKVLISWGLTPPTCINGSNPFNSSTRHAALYVPKAALEAYQTAEHWKNFSSIVPIEDVGDVNNDGNISIGDVTALIDLLLGNEAGATATQADVNLDGGVTIADVAALIDRLMAGN